MYGFHARAIQLMNLGETLGDAQIGDMEVSTLPILFTSKKAPSPWNFHGEGHLSAPDLGLASSCRCHTFIQHAPI